MTVVDYAADKELIDLVAREIRRVEYDSPRYRATIDMAARAIALTRRYDRQAEATESEDTDAD